jgi:hypothetical protein
MHGGGAAQPTIDGDVGDVMAQEANLAAPQRLVDLAIDQRRVGGALKLERAVRQPK